ALRQQNAETIRFGQAGCAAGTGGVGTAVSSATERRLEIQPVGASKPVFREGQLELALPFFKAPRIIERLDAFAAVDVDEPQLEGAGLQLTRFVPDVVVPALEPPEHDFLIGTS